ncbi:hypothetical protein KY290_028579 [Solanum tuberosum]|uniref:DRBM domain-containing protein n=1 Tax=Solanum tuberosum TaxID=4113 RepID=A0ABQ7UK68_SOLTU|nr:hypothetical protein KY290_028579 [Solanum tuberosum]
MPQATINFKHTWLQELCHQIAWNLPEYATEKDGPDHIPRFTATVTVNGVSFESPKDQWRSSKEAQNHAAHIAYDHFIVPNMDIFQQRQNKIGQLSRVNGTALAS